MLLLTIFIGDPFDVYSYGGDGEIRSSIGPTYGPRVEQGDTMGFTMNLTEDIMEGKSYVEVTFLHNNLAITTRKQEYFKHYEHRIICSLIYGNTVTITK